MVASVYVWRLVEEGKKVVVLTVACKEQSNVAGTAPKSVLDDFGQDGHDDSIDDLNRVRSTARGKAKRRNE